MFQVTTVWAPSAPVFTFHDFTSAVIKAHAIALGDRSHGGYDSPMSVIEQNGQMVRLYQLASGTGLKLVDTNGQDYP